MLLHLLKLLLHLLLHILHLLHLLLLQHLLLIHGCNLPNQSLTGSEPQWHGWEGGQEGKGGRMEGGKENKDT